jgi:drug/metabolite transporter (DMT)-like permease
MSARQWLLLIFLSVLWGGSFLFVGLSVREVPPLTLVLARVGLAAAVLLPLSLMMGLRFPLSLSGWRPFAVMAVLNNIVPFLLIVRGQKEIASGLASLLNATTPLWSVTLAHLLTSDEKLEAHRFAGVLIGIGGVAVLVGPEALLGHRMNVVGMLLVLGAAIFYGLSGIWGRRFKDTPPLVTAAAQLTCSTLLLLPLALLIDQPWTLPAPSASALWALVGLAVLSTALAYIVFFRIMAVSGPTNAMLVTLLVPVSAIAFGVAFLGETIVARQVLGAFVIGVSLLVIDGRVLGRTVTPGHSQSQSPVDDPRRP